MSATAGAPGGDPPRAPGRDPYGHKDDRVGGLVSGSARRESLTKMKWTTDNVNKLLLYGMNRTIKPGEYQTIANIFPERPTAKAVGAQLAKLRDQQHDLLREAKLSAPQEPLLPVQQLDLGAIAGLNRSHGLTGDDMRTVASLIDGMDDPSARPRTQDGNSPEHKRIKIEGTGELDLSRVSQEIREWAEQQVQERRTSRKRLRLNVEVDGYLREMLAMGQLELVADEKGTHSAHGGNEVNGGTVPVTDGDANGYSAEDEDRDADHESIDEKVVIDLTE